MLRRLTGALYAGRSRIAIFSRSARRAFSCFLRSTSGGSGQTTFFHLTEERFLHRVGTIE